MEKIRFASGAAVPAPGPPPTDLGNGPPPILEPCPTCRPTVNGGPTPYRDRLADLTGPASGHVVLPELGWTGRTDYDLDDPADAAVLYERVLVDAVRTQDVTRLLNAGQLLLLWSRLFLPARVRHLWETRFSDLSAAA